MAQPLDWECPYFLSLYDVVRAHEKAWFQTPYSTFRQSPVAIPPLCSPRLREESLQMK